MSKKCFREISKCVLDVLKCLFWHLERLEGGGTPPSGGAKDQKDIFKRPKHILKCPGDMFWTFLDASRDPWGYLFGIFSGTPRRVPKDIFWTF